MLVDVLGVVVNGGGDEAVTVQLDGDSHGAGGVESNVVTSRHLTHGGLQGKAR